MSDKQRAAANTQLGRRRFLTGAGSALLLAGLPALSTRATTGPAERWISAHGDNEQDYGIGWVDAGTPAGRDTATGFRGHAILQHGQRRNSVLFVARRPGTRGVEIDLDSGVVVASFDCAPNRHLFGHGCFSTDGKVLFTTEGDITAGTGRIVVRDADDYSVLQEWPSGGVGPHDIRMLPDGKTLVVANGGILTRPDTGRKKLNLDSMRSSLSYIDIGSGKLLEEFRVAEPKSSIRHLDVAADGTVSFAIQLQRQAAGHEQCVPLAGVHRPGEGLSLFTQPTTIIDNFADYVGSTAICNESRLAGFASPRGNLAAFWHIDSGELAGYHQLRDVCGIAVSRDRHAFVLSNSFGELRELDASTLQERRDRRVKLPGYRWDNHLLVTHSA